jgi:hypothetical protein
MNQIKLIEVLIIILLIVFIYLIKTNRDCLLITANSILLIVLLNNYIVNEHFQMSDQAYLKTNNNPIINSQARQDMELENLEKNVALVKAMLNHKLEQPGKGESLGIKFDNTNVVSVEENEAGLTARNVVKMNDTEVNLDNLGSESDRDALPG